MDLDLFLKLEPLTSGGMSIFQMQNFVINENITPYRKLRQAIIELRARLEVLTSSQLDFEESELKRQKLIEERDLLTGIDQKLKDIEIRRLDLVFNRRSTQLAQYEKEAEFFVDMVRKITDEVGGFEKAQEVLSDPTLYNQTEEDYWTKRLARGMYSDFVNFGTVTKGVLESIVALPVEQQHKIVNIALANQDEFSQLLNNTRDALLVERD
jgi:hypothetical protein